MHTGRSIRLLSGLTFACFLLFGVPTQFAFAQTRVKIAVWGDSRENRDGACEQIADILLHKITDWDFQIHTGDFTSNGSDAAWQRSLNYKGIDSLFVPGKFYMCTSNHDDNRTTYDKYTAGVLPVNSLDSTTHFYAVHRGNVHVVFCDGYFTDAGTMNRWLDAVLDTIPPDDWIIGVWHNPCYGDITYKRGYLHKCRSWLDKLYAHGGDFVIHGHAHVYVRTFPLLPNGSVDPRGMVHIVNGCGGASWKSPQPVTPKTAYTPKTTSFACITFITIKGDTALVQTVDARPGRNLRVIDEWRWVRTATGVQRTGQLPSSFRLYQNSPNPFTGSTLLRYVLPKSSRVRLTLYDVRGAVVATLVDAYQQAGVYAIPWGPNEGDRRAADLPNGVYICRLETEGFASSIKMTLLR